jgi:hypothetical protein
MKNYFFADILTAVVILASLAGCSSILPARDVNSYFSGKSAGPTQNGRLRYASFDIWEGFTGEYEYIFIINDETNYPKNYSREEVIKAFERSWKQVNFTARLDRITGYSSRTGEASGRRCTRLSGATFRMTTGRRSGVSGP